MEGSYSPNGDEVVRVLKSGLRYTNGLATIMIGQNKRGVTHMEQQSALGLGMRLKHGAEVWLSYLVCRVPRLWLNSWSLVECSYVM